MSLITGDTILVGALMNQPSNESTGSVYVYTHSGSTWTETTKRNVVGGPLLDKFGKCVEILDSNTFVVEAETDDANGEDSGSVFVFSL